MLSLRSHANNLNEDDRVHSIECASNHGYHVYIDHDVTYAPADIRIALQVNIFEFYRLVEQVALGFGQRIDMEFNVQHYIIYLFYYIVINYASCVFA